MLRPQLGLVANVLGFAVHRCIQQSSAVMQHNRRPFVADLGEGDWRLSAGEFWEGKMIVWLFCNPGACDLKKCYR